MDIAPVVPCPGQSIAEAFGALGILADETHAFDVREFLAPLLGPVPIGLAAPQTRTRTFEGEGNIQTDEEAKKLPAGAKLLRIYER